MFKINGNYSHPILTYEPIDYKKSTFMVEYSHKAVKTGHYFKIKFDVFNEEIKHIIDSKLVCFSIQVESSKAFYRKNFETYDYEYEIFLSNNEVIDMVEIGTALLVKESIKAFKSEDFVDDFEDMTFDLKKNEVIGVYPSIKKDIYSKQEVLKEVSSIFTIIEDEEVNSISYDTSNNKIKVTLPKDVSDYYKKCKNNDKKYNLQIINAIIFVPILTGVISDMLNFEEVDNYSSFAWYKTLISKMEKYEREAGVSVEKQKDDAFETAQRLMKNINIESIKTFVRINEESAEEE